MKKKIVKQIDLNELHKYYYERFSLLHNFLCKKNIQYYAVGGTLLGAIRHNGIIPWDDDMDIAMTRDNYEKFLKIANELDSRYFVVTNYRFTKRTEHAIAKVSLVGFSRAKARFNTKTSKDFHIDIFPMDYVSSDSEKQNKLVKQICKYKELLYKKTRSFSGIPFIKKIFLIILRIFMVPITTNHICKRIDSLAISNNNSINIDRNVLWTSSGIYSYEKEIHSVECFGVPTIHKFGPTIIFVPEQFDEFLKTTYGKDYMTPIIREDNAMEGIYICEDFCELEK